MKIHLLTHVFNEQLLLPVWIEWHKQFCDAFTIVNHQSTDNSMAIAVRELPYGSSIINTQMNDFSAGQLDVEMMEIERSIQTPDTLKLILNVTEFLFIPNFKEKIQNLFKTNPGAQAFGIRSICMVDKELNQPFNSPLDRTHGYMDYKCETRRRRYIHNQPDGQYQLGRHAVNLAYANISDFYLLWFGYSPWPECKQRKLQIQTRRTQFDIQNRLGFEHDITEVQLEENYKQHLNRSGDLLLDPVFKNLYHSLI